VTLLKRHAIYGLALLVGLPILVLAFGCERSVASRDREERRDPELQRARAMRMKPSDAVVAYRALLDSNPMLALAHLDLALLLHDQSRDFVGAIYHYRRYLELRPKAEKRDLIEQRIRKAEVVFAATVVAAQPASGVTNAAQTEERDPAARMLEENAWLRVEMARLTQENEDLRAASAATQTVAMTPAVAPVATVSSLPAVARPASTKPAVQRPHATATQLVVSAGAVSSAAARPATTKPAVPVAAGQSSRRHRVHRGETLGSIAQAVYGDKRQWKRVFEANRDLLKGNPDRLREGLVLVLP